MQVRFISFNRAIFSHHFDILFAMLTIGSSIVRSRKRKLRELYALATDSNAALNTTTLDLDAPPSTPAEKNFIVETDILL